MLPTDPRVVVAPVASDGSRRVSPADYSPVTANFPYPGDVISRLTIGKSPGVADVIAPW